MWCNTSSNLLSNTWNAYWQRKFYFLWPSQTQNHGVQRNMEVVSCLQKHPIMTWDFENTFPLWFSGNFSQISWPLWAESGVSNSRIREFFAGFLSGLVKAICSRGLMSSTFFLQSIPWIYMHIRCEDDAKDKMVNGCTDMKPTQTRWAAKRVSWKTVRAEQAWTDSEVRQSFYRIVAGERKDTLFNVKLFPIQPEATWKHQSDSALKDIYIQSS